MAPLTFAHRGGTDGGFRENSLEAFADALERGCEIETDLRLSADRQVVCAHDSFTFIGLLPVWIARTPATMLGRLGVPTLERLYGELGTSFEISADLKKPAAAARAVAIARAAGAVEHLWLVSDDVQELVAIRADDRDIRLVHETRHQDLAKANVTAEDHLERLAAERIDAADTTVSDWSPALVDQAHELGLRSFGSLLQNRSAMDSAVAIGLDGFYSDHLELMRAAVEGVP